LHLPLTKVKKHSINNFKKKKFRRESRKDGEKLAPDEIRGTSPANIQASARATDSYSSNFLSPLPGLGSIALDTQGFTLG